MAHRKYLLTYPDGQRRHIDRETRDHLLLSLQAKQTGPDRYRFTGQTKVFHSFSELGELCLEPTAPLRRFIEGSFVFELGTMRRHELMETPEGMAFRMVRDGTVANA